MPLQDFRKSESYRYHQATKHSLESLYSSPGGLDWQQQPDPFRVYKGSERICLERRFGVSEQGIFACLNALFESNLPQAGNESLEKEIEQYETVLSSASISSLLFYSLAISAWKQIKGTSHKWSLRVNPSSGNLHPTEIHLLIRNCSGMADGAYHYSVKDHCLEKRISGDLNSRLWSLLAKSDKAVPDLVLVLSSIFWRESWKYRDRAYRYCQLDMGHAAGSVALAAGTLNWSYQLIGEFPDIELSELLDLAKTDEKPQLIIPVFARAISDAASVRSYQMSLNKTLEAKIHGPDLRSPDPKSVSVLETTFNQLSASPIRYLSIDSVYQAGVLGASEFLERRSLPLGPEHLKPPLFDKIESEIDLGEYYRDLENDPPAHAVARRRRSAVDMDGCLRISATSLARILIASSRHCLAPFLESAGCKKNETATASHSFIHFLLYLHKIAGIESGVYCFEPLSCRLKLLQEGDIRSHAAFVSCLQDIAAAGAFAVSLVADMESAFSIFGERAYRYVHQEAGFIGQLFYLTAKALGIDATGIGCFLDDEINKSLPEGMQVVYNFTFGRAITDERLSDLPIYDFEDPSRRLWSRIPVI